MTSTKALPKHPRLLIASSSGTGLRTVTDLRNAIRSGHAQQLWQELLSEAEADLERPAYRPDMDCLGRSEADIRIANREYALVGGTCRRLTFGALAGLILGQRRFVDGVLEQLACVYDHEAWPEWRDQAHMPDKPNDTYSSMADLRTGQFMRAIGYTYDWLYPMLTPEERAFVRDGLWRRGISPYLKSLKRQAGWAVSNEPNNWQTCIVGGAGIAAMAMYEDFRPGPKVLAYAVSKMANYLKVIGPDGEFNENPAYAGAMRFPIDFYATLRGFQRENESLLTDPRVRKVCYWYMQNSLPGGRIVPIGDNGGGKPVTAAMVLPVAAACRDGVLQSFYLENLGSARSDAAMELLNFDPTIEPEGLGDALPLGIAYRYHSANWVSRTGWSADDIVVYGKGGRGTEGHGHHDAGMVCVEAKSEPLLLDIGCPMYPQDYFTLPARYAYYFASVRGHNTIIVGDRETHCKGAAKVNTSELTPEVGFAWASQLAPLYDGVSSLRRTVVHLLPGVIVVVDRIRLKEADEVRQRWHTADRCEPAATGAFTVQGRSTHLASQLVRLDEGPVRFERGEHSFAPPYDHDRRGALLPQAHESYIDTIVDGTTSCQLMALFAVDGEPWTTEDGVYRSGDVSVSLHQRALSVSSPERSIMIQT